MNRNIEIKARLDPQTIEEVQAKTEKIATDGPIELSQTDTFFCTQSGRLKLREFTDGSAELISYQRPDSTGPKTSHYIRSECHSPLTMKQALGEALGIIGVVKKERLVFLVGPTRIHIDRVEGLGTFLELEVVLNEFDSVHSGEAIANELMKKLAIAPAQLVPGSYIDLLATAKT